MKSQFQQHLIAAGAAAAFSLTASVSFADSIDPVSYTDTLALGESVTIRKTVTVDEGTASDAALDVFFLIDTSGSMGSVINAAKAAASDIFTDLTSTFGSDVAGGAGVFSEGAYLPGAFSPPGTVLNQDITTNQADVVTAIGTTTLSNPDGGGDFPESAYTAVELVAENASWRPGSNRFIFTFSDASAKGSPVADVAAALAAEDITLVSLDYGFGAHETSMDAIGALYDDVFTYRSTASAADVVDDISAGITAGFAEYDTVTVGDLGNGLPEIAVSTTCVSADIGACVGADAVGDYDRSVTRSFEFDVTFTRVAEGDTTFTTFGLVDGGIIAREIDTFRSSGSTGVPEPAALLLLPTALGGLAAARRRRARA